MKTSKKIWIAGAVMALLYGHAALGGLVSWTTNQVDWSTNYYNPDVQSGGQYDGVPTNASPKWTAQYTATSSLVDSYFRISTAGGSRLNYFTTSNWDLSGDATVEARLRVVSQTGASGAGSIRFGNAAFYGTVLFGTNNVGTVEHDFTQWTTVRLVFEGMTSTNTATVKVYLNNDPTVAYTSTKWSLGTTLNQLSFGDPNTTSTDGTVDWDYIAWKSGSAIAPVIPEPATIGMMGLGALIAFVYRRKMTI